MTCPCGEYEFVDSTNDSLGPALLSKCHKLFSIIRCHLFDYSIDHRDQCNRIIHEKLTGSPLMPLEMIDRFSRP